MKSLSILLLSLFCAVQPAVILAQYVLNIPLSVSLIVSDTLFDNEALKKEHIRSITYVDALLRPYEPNILDTFQIWNYHYDSLYRCRHAIQIGYDYRFTPSRTDTTFWRYNYEDEMATEYGQSKDAIRIWVKSAGKMIAYKRYILRDSTWQLQKYDTSIYLNNRLHKELWMMYGHDRDLVDTVQVFYEYDTSGFLSKRIVQPPKVFKTVLKSHSGFSFEQSVEEYVNEGEHVIKHKRTVFDSPGMGKGRIEYDYNIIRQDFGDDIIYETTTSLVLKDDVTRYIKARGDLNDMVEYYLGETVHRTNRPHSSLPAFISISTGNSVEFLTFYYQMW